jgi:peptidoglycan/xylan/chitin deacetylase (PgdA/CDA1 family)
VFVVTGFVDRALGLWPDRIENAMLRGKGSRLEVECNGRSHAFSLSDENGRRAALTTLVEAAKTVPDRERSVFVAQIESAMGLVPGDPLPAEYAPMTWDQVRACAAGGIEIGSHTVTHPILSLQSRDEQLLEMRESRSKLQDRIQQGVTTMAYPNGQITDFTDETKQIARECGYQGAASTVYGFSRPVMDAFAVRRMAARSDPRGFRQVLSGFQRFGAH